MHENLLPIVNDYVRVSEMIKCPKCGESVTMIGETKANGNWWCINCGQYFPYRENNFPVSQLFTKVSQPTQLKLGGPLGDPPEENFPMDLETSFLVPSYSSAIHRRVKTLVEVTEDYTRTGRLKNLGQFAFDLKFNQKTLDEYETLLAFWETQRYHLPFNYTDPFRNTSHICYFDSEVEAEPESFDLISFSVRITE